MYQKAIEKLKNIQKDNLYFLEQIESGEFKINAPQDRIKSLCDTYRWWGHCAGMAAYLLEQANDADCSHEWVSADNAVVTGGEICTKCHAIRAPAVKKKGGGDMRLEMDFCHASRGHE